MQETAMVMEEGDPSVDSPVPARAAARVSDVETHIRGLAAQEATGCLVVADRRGEEGLVWLRDGQVYAVSVPGRRPLLGVRLVAGGMITGEQLEHALAVQRTEMPMARLGEVLVALHLVNRRTVEDFVLEQQRDMLADLITWSVVSHYFRNGARTRTDLSAYVEVDELLRQAHHRQGHWGRIVQSIGGFDVIPLPTGAPAQVPLSGSEAVVLREVDGIRTLMDIADRCGFTVFEAAQVTEGLMAAGLVTTAQALLAPPATEPVQAEGEGPAEHMASVVPLHVVEEPPAAAPTPLPAEPAPTPPAEAPAPAFAPAAFAPAEIPVPEYAQLPPPSAAPVAPAAPAEPADTAALMRELSGLSVSDEEYR